MRIRVVLFLWMVSLSLALEYRSHDAYSKFKRINMDGPGAWPALGITIGVMVLLFIGAYCIYRRNNLAATNN